MREVGFKRTEGQQSAHQRCRSPAGSMQQANDLKVRSTGLDAKIEQLDMRSHELVREVKKVGPSLKEVRMKLRKEWIPVWLKDPHAWREGTKMPTFRLDDDEIRAIARVHLAVRRAGRLAAAEAGRSRKGQGSLRNARLHGLPLHGRGRPEAGRHLRRQPQPRRRKGQLRLPGALGPQSAPAHRALLPLRKEGPDQGRLRQAQPALRLRPGTRQVPQRRPRTAGAADDPHAQPAAHRGRSARHRQLPDDPQARPTPLTPTPTTWTIPT